MDLSDQVMRMIARGEFVISPVTRASDLYIDLGYDSLALVRLLLEMEEAFSIQFDLVEMGMCLKTDRLIALVERKVRERLSD